MSTALIIAVVIVLIVLAGHYQKTAASTATPAAGTPETFTLSGYDPQYKCNGTYVYVGLDASKRKIYKATSPPAAGQDADRYLQILHDGTIQCGNVTRPGQYGPGKNPKNAKLVSN